MHGQNSPGRADQRGLTSAQCRHVKLAAASTNGVTGAASDTPLDAFASEHRWVAWCNELRGRKPTKVPYAPSGKRAKADDPSTCTRAEAEARAAKIVNGLGGGVGILLGDLGADTFLAGIDLDSCLSESSTLTPWARRSSPPYPRIPKCHHRAMA
jgi:hypothetical protein